MYWSMYTVVVFVRENQTKTTLQRRQVNKLPVGVPCQHPRAPTGVWGKGICSRKELTAYNYRQIIQYIYIDIDIDILRSTAIDCRTLRPRVTWTQRLTAFVLPNQDDRLCFTSTLGLILLIVLYIIASSYV